MTAQTNQKSINNTVKVSLSNEEEKHKKKSAHKIKTKNVFTLIQKKTENRIGSPKM